VTGPTTIAPTEQLLLRALLHPDLGAAADAAERYLGQVDVQALPWSQTRLFPALYRRMVAGGARPPALLKGMYRQSWTQNQARFHAAATAMRDLESAGIRTLVLKGASLIPAYGGDWGVRDMSDVDLLVDTANAHRAAALLESAGWRPIFSTTAEAAMARYFHRRHSWNFERAQGGGVDLHWHVLQGSRGPDSDRDFFEAAVPLELGSVHTARLCDADLLVHLVEHASHAEPPSELMWIVDVVHLARSTDAAALAERFTTQAEAHDLVEIADERLARIGDLVEVVGDEVDGTPTIELVRARLRTARRRTTPPPGVRARLAEYRRGGTPLLAAARALAAAEADAALTARPRAWNVYVALGRRPRVERWLARGGPLARVPTPPPPPPDPDGWWQMSTPETVDALCGPGWSYPESRARGVWTDGSEARLVMPAPPGADALAVDALAVDLELTLLGRHGGPARAVGFRALGRTLATMGADDDNSTHAITLPLSPTPWGTVDLSLRIRGAARPVDLGIGPDIRRLGLLLLRLRLRPLAGD